jgi:SWI/SNF-related matrix-associated actin-dependent regulator 1 of chromatin subfamily A
MQQARLGKNCIRLIFRFPYGDPRFDDMKESVKKIPGREYIPSLKAWQIPRNINTAEKVLKLGFDPSPELSRWIEEQKKERTKAKKSLRLPAGLREFQKIGVRAIEEFGGRAVLADKPGLGKTVQSLAWLKAKNSHARPALIVVPAVVKRNWFEHCKRWLNKGERVYVASGASRKSLHNFSREIGLRTAQIPNVLIINYDILAEWKGYIQEKFRPKTVIFDEAHYVKNSKAKRTRAARSIAKRCQYVIPLTGTPIENRPSEFFNILNMTRPELFPSFFNYALRYCDAKRGPWGWDFSGASNLDELHLLLKTSVMIRRNKEDVLPDLPAKQSARVAFEADPSAMAEYNKANADFLDWITNNFSGEELEKKIIGALRAEALTQMNTLRQLAFDCKKDSAIKWIRDFLESGEKLVVFCIHKRVVDTLLAEFKDIAVKIDGRTPQDERHGLAQKFQTDPNTRLFIGTPRAAGVGIDLFAANNVAFVEFPWTPGELEQAEDRTHRIGQKNSVTTWHLMAEGTIDESIISTISGKKKVIDRLLDAKTSEAASGDTLLEVINQLYNRIKEAE